MMYRTLLKNSVKTTPKTDGFSILEVILVIGVIAVFASLGSPDIASYLNIKKEQDERLVLQDIEKAIVSRIKNEGLLFNASTMQEVVDELAGSINRPERELLTDTWKHDRYMIHITEDEFISGDILEVHGLVVYSFGRDNCPAETTACTESDRTAHIANLKTKLEELNDIGGSASAAVNTEGDEYIYISDRDERVFRYNQALERLSRLAKSLEEYSKLRLNESLALGITNASELTHYPPSTYSGDLTTYATKVRADTTTALAEVGASGSVIFNGTPGVRTPSAAQESLDMYTARQGMLALTKVLGLPPSNCCSGLQTFEYDGKVYSAPFYYYSRPGRPVSSTGSCYYKNNFPASISINKREDCWGTGMPS